MRSKNITRWVLTLVLLAGIISPSTPAQATSPQTGAAQSGGVTPFDLILAMNSVRVSNGLPALIEDPIIMAVAQSTAEIMATNQMSWHIGDVSGRLAAAGYGGGPKVWATENFAVGNQSIDEIMIIWSDASHMIPAANPAYCNVGAGVAKSSNGRTYYVLQAAYTASQACGEYKSSGGNTQSGGNANPERPSGISQLIVPVKVATPDADGRIFHTVAAGQSFWAIAIAYKVTIKDIETWNNLSKDAKLQVGQKLFIPGSNTKGYSTPTPVGMIMISAPDQEGKIIHEVQPYQTLITIADAYRVKMDLLLAFNGITVETPLQIGQRLVIDPGKVTPTPTPLTPLQMLTPDSDGRYYHTVQSGETLSWIAQLYEVSVNELMAWNGLDATSIIRPDQKLLLQVKPPATDTPAPPPATSTSTSTATPEPSLTPAQALTPLAAAVQPVPPAAGSPVPTILPLGLAAVGLALLLAVLLRKRVDHT